MASLFVMLISERSSYTRKRRCWGSISNCKKEMKEERKKGNFHSYIMAELLIEQPHPLRCFSLEDEERASQTGKR